MGNAQWLISFGGNAITVVSAVNGKRYWGWSTKRGIQLP